MEVDTLKQRLDGLRKAKNTTIVKREREEVHILPPQLGHRRPSQQLPRLQQNSSQVSLHSESNGGSSSPSVMERELSDQLDESRRERDKLSADLLACQCEWEEKEKLLKRELEVTERRHSSVLLGLREELDKAHQVQLEV